MRSTVRGGVSKVLRERGGELESSMGTQSFSSRGSGEGQWDHEGFNGSQKAFEVLVGRLRGVSGR